jgi:hypothetical protein
MRVACVHVNIIPLAVMMFSVRASTGLSELILSFRPASEDSERERDVCVQCIYFGGCGRRAIKHGHSKSAPDMGCIIIGLHSRRALAAQPEREREMRARPAAARYGVLPLLCRCVAQAAAANSHYTRKMNGRDAHAAHYANVGAMVISGIAGINLIFQVLKTAIMERSGSRINHSARHRHNHAASRSLLVL